VVDDNEARLVQQRKTLEDLLARSRAYINGAPELTAG
jgi:hypothetical protein